MDALDVLKVCLRRWYVMLPVVMMALGAGYALAKDQKPSYHARATFAFVYQNTQTTPGGVDPRLANPLASNDLLGAALGFSLATPETQERLGDPTASGVPLDQPSSHTRFAFAGEAFTYSVDSWARTPDAARTTVENVMAAIPDEVKRLQESAGAPRGSLSTIFVMSPTRVELVPPGSGVKVLIGVGAVGAVAGAALSIAVDAFAGRRSRRGGRRRRRAEDGEQPVGPTGEVRQAEQRAAEEKSGAVEPGVDEPRAEEAPVEDPPAGEPPVEEPQVAQPPADEVPAEEVSADEVLADEVLADEVSADDVPADEVSAEAVPVDEARADEPVAGAGQVDEAPDGDPQRDERPHAQRHAEPVEPEPADHPAAEPEIPSALEQSPLAALIPLPGGPSEPRVASTTPLGTLSR